MIKCEKGLVQMQGTKIELLEEFTYIAHALLDKGIADKELLDFSMMLATSTKEDLNKMIIKMIDDMDDIGEAFKLLGMYELLNA